MTRGDVVLTASGGEYGKPRPALVIQADVFQHHPSVTVCLITSHHQETPLYRYQIEPNVDNGLVVVSQVQIDKIMTVSRQKVGKTIGVLTARQMNEITRLLALWIGIGS